VSLDVPVDTATAAPPPPAGESVLHGLARAARPRQWLKNLLVFAAPAAAHVLRDGGVLWRTIAAFGAFCLSSSGLYLVNDVADRDTDRAHPTKHRRPIASGVVPVRTALIVAVVLVACGLGLAAATGRVWLVAAVLAHATLTLAYTWRLKHVAVVDLVTVSLGFVVRALAGGAAARVPLSNWFVICTSFGSLFVVAGKRLAELDHLEREGRDAASVRATLETYSTAFLRLVIGVAMAVTMLAYCLWAFERASQSQGHGRGYWYELSIVPMVTALLRYALLLDDGHGGAPEDVFLSDRAIQVLGLGWVVLVALGIRGA
jgi:decaprenyl-phosphate phosphoribosyltransferase